MKIISPSQKTRIAVGRSPATRDVIEFVPGLGV